MTTPTIDQDRLLAAVRGAAMQQAMDWLREDLDLPHRSADKVDA